MTSYRKAFSSFNRNAKLVLAYYAVVAVANGSQNVLLNLYYLKAGLDRNWPEEALRCLTEVYLGIRDAAQRWKD
ncbi:MAG TPA: hypothetical protein GX510_03475 [Firmicutes bacterium]|nr:hypothetical protein [Candidatus Fermentithermobacillaceae bacterium]